MTGVRLRGDQLAHQLVNYIVVRNFPIEIVIESLGKSGSQSGSSAGLVVGVAKNRGASPYSETRLLK